MKIIEAMKELKRLAEKAADLRVKCATFCADLDFETPTYPDQKRQIQEWVQSHQDTVQRIAELRTAIQRTNLETMVTIELNGRPVAKSIAEWIHRRGNPGKKDGLAHMDLAVWTGIGDKNLKEGTATSSTGQPTPVHIRRYYDPAERDAKMAIYRDEPHQIDAQLEVTNAVTDVIGL